MPEVGEIARRLPSDLADGDTVEGDLDDDDDEVDVAAVTPVEVRGDLCSDDRFVSEDCIHFLGHASSL